MRTLKIFIIVTSSMMVGFLLWNLTLSSDYKVVVEKELTAGTDEVYSEMNDLQNWQEWAAYLRRDSTKSIVYSEPSFGERAWVEWKLQGNYGGRLEIVSSTDTSISLELSFTGATASKSTIDLAKSEVGTKVTWTAYGELPFFARFAKGSLEKTINQDFKTTLTNLDEHLK